MAKRRGNHEGSIYNRSDGNWRAQIAIGGEWLSYAAKSRKEAQDWLRRINNQLEVGLDSSSARMTFGEYLEEWLNSKRHHITDHSWRTYCQLIKDYIEPSLGMARLAEISPTQIQRLYNQKAKEGIGLRTVQKLHTVIHAALNTALKSGLIGRNPSNSANPRSQSKRRCAF